MTKMPRKGTARIKKTDKYVYCGHGGDEARNTSAAHSQDEPQLGHGHDAFQETDEKTLKLPNLSSEPSTALQPRQASSPTVEQTILSRPRSKHPSTKPQPLPETTATSRFQTSATSNADAPLANDTTAHSGSAFVTHPKHPERQLKYPDTMIQGGAFIPPNQQRNMRACMVCSIVRTQQQFLTQGCPNCEHLLELAGNSDQINDCTSQVFEGLISVADTSKSWVARYQRLEGYVPGVYATQVEGILPDDILVAVENAGINYVPRDGSEQEMLGKD